MDAAKVFAVIEANMRRVMAGAKGRTIDQTTRLRDFEGDSLELVEVVSRSMNELRVSVPLAELSKARTVKDLLGLFEAAPGARGDYGRS